MLVNEEECKAAAISIREVERIAGGLSRYARQADDMGLIIFGGTGGGTLRAIDGIYPDNALIVAELDGYYSGGDGAELPYSPDGLKRAE